MVKFSSYPVIYLKYSISPMLCESLPSTGRHGRMQASTLKPQGWMKFSFNIILPYQININPS